MKGRLTYGIGLIGSCWRASTSAMVGVPASGQRGARPDSSAYSVAAREYTSPNSVGGRRSKASGGAYAGVMASIASLSSMPGSGMVASPKSARPALPYASIKMLAGLTSRCSTPRA